MADDRPSRLWLIFAMFFVALNYPLLLIADRSELFWGFPKLYFYFFALWAAIIYAMARTVKGRR